MAFWDLLVAASMPSLQVLIIAMVGAALATDRCRVLTADARRHLNQVVYYAFAPCLIFGSLARTVTLQDIISWWFMPVNIGLIFTFGTFLGWTATKILRPEAHIRNIIIAFCSSGNLGNLMIIIIPAVCSEAGSPFGNPQVCRDTGLSYATFSMALGAFYIWTHTYSLMQEAGEVLKRNSSAIDDDAVEKIPNRDSNSDEGSFLLNCSEPTLPLSTVVDIRASGTEGTKLIDDKPKMFSRAKEILHHIKKELLSLPNCSAIAGLVVGAAPWLRHLIIGGTAPLRVVEDAIKLLGDGTIPSVTLILGGNLIRGLTKSAVKPSIILSVIIVRYVLLPAFGIAAVKGAVMLKILPSDNLFAYVLMTQYTLPPAMSIGTMAEFFDVAREECSVLFLYTYLAAAIALTLWSTVYMWILT